MNSTLCGENLNNMGLLDTNGDGSAYVKYSNGQVKVGAGSADQLSVGGGGVTVANQLTVAGDLNIAGGGQVKTYEYFAYKTLQGTTPVMSASQITVSGTATAGNGATFYYTKQPLRGSGSIVGISLFSEDGTVKSGSLTASLFINGAFQNGAVVAIGTGSLASVGFSKDAIPFSGSGLLTVQLTCSSGYLADVATSCSWGVVVEVEF
jgi:hypothetical protein